MAKFEIERRYDADGRFTHVDTIEVDVSIEIVRSESCGWGEVGLSLEVLHTAEITHRRVLNSHGLTHSDYSMGAPTELTDEELEELGDWLTAKLEPQEDARGCVVRHLTEELMDAAKGEFRSETTGQVVKDEPFDRHAHELKMAADRCRPESRQAVEVER